jgi:hypothetical protein
MYDRAMRLVLACFLVACSGPVDDVLTTPIDATTARDTSTSFVDVVSEKPSGPVYVGGPLGCGNCTCDGTLYMCCYGTPHPPPSDAGADAHADADADADADAVDADASDAMSCGATNYCSQIPIACLPKPTCDCITKETGMQCAVSLDGDGFRVTCP